MPDNPRGWLVAVASRRMTDRIRSDSARRRREDADAALAPAGVGEQHEGQQPGYLAVVGQQPVDEAGQPDGLSGQVAALQ